eukprot:7133-Heterococcus_DN1.PRE.2
MPWHATGRDHGHALHDCASDAPTTTRDKEAAATVHELHLAVRDCDQLVIIDPPPLALCRSVISQAGAISNSPTPRNARFTYSETAQSRWPKEVGRTIRYHNRNAAHGVG